MTTVKITIKNVLTPSQVLDLVPAFPEAIRPTTYGEAENTSVKNQKPLADREEFKKFAEAKPNGYVLFLGRSFDIDFDFASKAKKVFCPEIKNATREDIDDLFRAVSNYSPIFGFAADYDEYRHRNFLEVEISLGTAELWIGRDETKYIPGLFWKTYVSDSLLARHNLNVELFHFDDLDTQIERMGNGYLLTFFDDPAKWKAFAPILDKKCEKIDGLFSRTVVETALANATTVKENEEIVYRYK